MGPRRGEFCIGSLIALIAFMIIPTNRAKSRISLFLSHLLLMVLLVQSSFAHADYTCRFVFSSQNKHDRAIDAAEAAGLHYIEGASRGISRIQSGDSFSYVNEAGRTIDDSGELARFKSMLLPPRAQNIWISADPLSHIQATLVDSAGRKQYVYHPLWKKVMAVLKFTRTVEFGQLLPRVRSTVERDLLRAGAGEVRLDKEAVIATVIRLLEVAVIRVGSKEYAEENGTFGLTTMLKSQIQVEGDQISFKFTGKSSVEHDFSVHDRLSARAIEKLLASNPENTALFLVAAPSGGVRSISAGEVNKSLEERAGGEFTAKDFRTWIATVTAAKVLVDLGPAPSDAKELIAHERSALEAASARLRNTPEVARESYVSPEIFRAYRDGRLQRAFQEAADAKDSTRPVEEAAVLRVLSGKTAL
jgi:DNA topoisomerase-1